MFTLIKSPSCCVQPGRCELEQETRIPPRRAAACSQNISVPWTSQPERQTARTGNAPLLESGRRLSPAERAMPRLAISAADAQRALKVGDGRGMPRRDLKQFAPGKTGATPRRRLRPSRWRGRSLSPRTRAQARRSLWRLSRSTLPLRSGTWLELPACRRSPCHREPTSRCRPSLRIPSPSCRAGPEPSA